MSIPTTITARGTTKLTTALHGFLVANALPDPAVATLEPKTATVAIQPDVAAYRDPVAVISTLLLWARGLDTVTAQWWRTTDDHLHISITGRLSSGVRVRLYKGVPYDTVREWVVLHGQDADGVSLDELAWLVGELHRARPAV